MATKFFSDDNATGTKKFWCPGCREYHKIEVGRYSITGKDDAPTVRPSVQIPGRCHVFISGGMLEYLGDCGHSLRAKTVKMEPIQA